MWCVVVLDLVRVNLTHHLPHTSAKALSSLHHVFQGKAKSGAREKIAPESEEVSHTYTSCFANVVCGIKPYVG